MARVRDMQGVPAHIETLKSDGKRRHISHCIYSKGKKGNYICKCTKSPNYNLECHSSSKCAHYSETK